MAIPGKQFISIFYSKYFVFPVTAILIITCLLGKVTDILSFLILSFAHCYFKPELLQVNLITHLNTYNTECLQKQQ